MTRLKSDTLQNHWLGKGIERALSSRELIEHRVRRGLIFSSGDRDRNADYLIESKIQRNTTYGVLAGITAFLPILGTIAAVTVTATAEFIIVTCQEFELCMEIAYNYGHDIDDEIRIFELLAIVGRKREIKSVKDARSLVMSKTMDTVIKRYIRIGFLKALSRTAKLLELKVGVRAFSNAIPVIGAGLSGFINYKITKSTGILAKEFYRRSLV